MAQELIARIMNLEDENYQLEHSLNSIKTSSDRIINLGEAEGELITHKLVKQTIEAKESAHRKAVIEQQKLVDALKMKL